MQIKQLIKEKNWMKQALRLLDEQIVEPHDLELLLEATLAEYAERKGETASVAALLAAAEEKGRAEGSRYTRKRLAEKAARETNWSAAEIRAFFDLDKDK